MYGGQSPLGLEKITNSPYALCGFCSTLGTFFSVIKLVSKDHREGWILISTKPSGRMGVGPHLGEEMNQEEQGITGLRASLQVMSP